MFTLLKGLKMRHLEARLLQKHTKQFSAWLRIREINLFAERSPMTHIISEKLREARRQYQQESEDIKELRATLFLLKYSV